MTDAQEHVFFSSSYLGYIDIIINLITTSSIPFSDMI